MAVTAEQLRETDSETGGRNYIYPPTGQRLISVTTVLSATDGKPFLVPWSARLAAEYAVTHLAELGQIADAEGFDAAVKLAKDQAKIVREHKADAGSYVHSVVEALILWAASPAGTGADITLPVLPEHLEDVTYDDNQPLPAVVDWMVTGFLNFVSAFAPQFEASEMVTFNVILGVAGTLDMIITLHGVAIGRDGRLVPAPGRSVTLCVDVKTGRHLDVTVPEQLAAYRKMTEALLPMGEIVPMPRTDAAAVLHLRPEHAEGYRLMLVSGADDAAAWNRFRRAVEIHAGRTAASAKPGKVCYPLRADGTMRSPRLADLDAEGYGRAPGALARAGVDDLAALTGMTATECLDLKGVGDKSLPVIRQMLADHGLHLANEETATEEAA
jgi:hypothetical protein